MKLYTNQATNQMVSTILSTPISPVGVPVQVSRPVLKTFMAFMSCARHNKGMIKVTPYFYINCESYKETLDFAKMFVFHRDLFDKHDSIDELTEYMDERVAYQLYRTTTLPKPICKKVIAIVLNEVMKAVTLGNGVAVTRTLAFHMEDGKLRTTTTMELENAKN